MCCGDNFGNSVSISGNTIVVGAYGDDGNGTTPGSGSAYIFNRNEGGNDNWGPVKKITASDAAAGDWFGYSTSIDGNTVVVGAYQKNDDAGIAYVFERPSGGWADMTETTKIIPDDGAADDYFGHSVSISGDTMVIGAYKDDDNGSESGSAYVYIAIDLCKGDFDHDGYVDGSDLAVFAADFGRTNCVSGSPCEGDFEPDGDVDGSDLAVFAADFGRMDCP